MKATAILLLLLAGCVAAPLPLEGFRGWSFRALEKDRFQINVGEIRKDRWEEALLYAASLSLQRGHRAFAIIEEDGKGESGTFFFWAQSYSGRAGMKSFSPGRYFTIVCRQESPTEFETWFDSSRLLKKMPNKAPEPTTTSGTSAAKQPLVPAAVVAHL